VAARSAYIGGVRALQPAATPKEKSRQAKAPPSPRKHALTAMELMRKAAEAFGDLRTLSSIWANYDGLKGI